MKKTFVSIAAVLVLVFAMVIPGFALEDGTYAVDYTLTTETGIQHEFVPVKLVVADGKTYARIVFNDAEVDKLILAGEEILPTTQMKSPYKNATGTYNVFELPVSLGEDIAFTLHTRGNNLVTDDYTLTVATYDEDFDADAQTKAVEQLNFGAQEYRFYHWHVGMSFSVWGPFVLLGLTALAIVLVPKFMF